jgi:hypothetical protein
MKAKIILLTLLIFLAACSNVTVTCEVTVTLEQV